MTSGSLDQTGITNRFCLFLFNDVWGGYFFYFVFGWGECLKKKKEASVIMVHQMIAHLIFYKITEDAKIRKGKKSAFEKGIGYERLL